MWTQPEHVLDLFGGILLVPAKDVRFVALCVSEFVHLGHSTEGDETYQGVGREKTQADDESITESFEVFFVETCVDYEDEDGGNLGGAREGVLNGRVFSEELGWEVGIRDILVVRRECVALKTKGTYPEFAADVDLAVEG